MAQHEGSWGVSPRAQSDPLADGETLCARQDDLPDLGAFAAPGREGWCCARGTGGEKLEQRCGHWCRLVVGMRLGTFMSAKLDRDPLCVV